MLFVKHEEYQRRMAICRDCKFYEPTTKSCGPLIIGKEVETEVKYRRKSIRLCGCVMPIKAKQGIFGCPAQKWLPLLSKEQIMSMRKIVLELKAKKVLQTEDIKLLFQMKSDLYGQKFKHQVCSVCVNKVIRNLLEWLPDLETLEDTTNQLTSEEPTSTDDSALTIE
jgi:hypothetical protein